MHTNIFTKELSLTKLFNAFSFRLVVPVYKHEWLIGCDNKETLIAAKVPSSFFIS